MTRRRPRTWPLITSPFVYGTVLAVGTIASGPDFFVRAFAVTSILMAVTTTWWVEAWRRRLNQTAPDSQNHIPGHVSVYLLIVTGLLTTQSGWLAATGHAPPAQITAAGALASMALGYAVLAVSIARNPHIHDMFPAWLPRSGAWLTRQYARLPRRPRP